MSRAWTTPISRSTVPSATGIRLCGASISLRRIVSSSASTSIQATSVRGVITSRIGRSASRTTLEIIARSLSSSTPAVAASATTSCSSSAVTWSSALAAQPQQPEDERAGPVEQPDERRHRLGEPAHRPRHDDRDRLGRAQRDLLGHQLADHQRGVGGEDDDQREAEGLRRLVRHAEQGDALARPAPPSAAPEKAPEMTAIRVMPLWTVERKRPGSAASSSAVWAPRRPARAIAFSRGRRDETIASSDMASTPFRITSSRMMITSHQGKGRERRGRRHRRPLRL